MNELRVVIDLLECSAGLVDIAAEHLFACDLGHGVGPVRYRGSTDRAGLPAGRRSSS